MWARRIGEEKEKKKTLDDIDEESNCYIPESLP
jgi:hypothetical protein